MQEKLNKLESRINIIENSVEPLLLKLDKVADNLTENTIQQARTEASHKG